MSGSSVVLLLPGPRTAVRNILNGARAAEVEIGMPEVGEEDAEELGRNESDGQYFSGKLHRS